jgi:hypothetical protein
MLAYKHVRTRRCRHPGSAADQSRHWSALSMGGRECAAWPFSGSCNVFDKARCENISYLDRFRPASSPQCPDQLSRG